MYAPPVTQTVFREKKYLWCKHTVKYLGVKSDEVYVALPPFSIVWYYYSSGSWKHTYVSFSKLFYVSETPKSETPLDSDLSLSHENLVHLPESLRNFDKVKAEMEVEGYAASQRFVNVNVNAYRILLLYRQCTSMQAQQTKQTQGGNVPSISGRVSSLFTSSGENK
jgi:hypothetical protein